MMLSKNPLGFPKKVRGSNFAEKFPGFCRNTKNNNKTFFIKNKTS